MKSEDKRLAGVACDGSVRGASWGMSAFGGAMRPRTFLRAELELGKLAWLELS